MVFDFLELGLIVFGLLMAVYYYLVSKYDYWESRGVKGPKPIILFGTVKDLMTNKCSIGSYVNGVYNAWKKEPFSGIFLRRTPVLVLHDLDLIKDVLIKDFSKFANRSTRTHEKIEPLSAHLFNIEAERWRPLRLKLSPVFTSGKLKEMFYLLVECAQHLDEFLCDVVDANGTQGAIIEVREFTAKFTTDVIGVCAFGLHMNAMKSEDSPFRVMGRRLFSFNFRQMLQFRLRTFAPWLYDIIGGFIVERDITDFFVNTMRKTIDYRKKNGVVKHDFIDLLMAIKDHPDKIPEIELTDNILAAQLFVFFIAGFETSSSTMSNVFYELAQNRIIQDKLKHEIKDEINRTGGILDYEGIKSMKYLDMVFQETLRKYTPVTFLMRKSDQPYTFRTNSNDNLLTMEAEQVIWIPIHGIQMDPQYFPKPEVFDPERFTDEAIKCRHPMTYLPFGDGPRNCIGKRFGVMQTKVGLVTILNKYSVEICEKTEIPYEINPKAFLLAPKNGIYVKIVRDHDKSTEPQP